MFDFGEGDRDGPVYLHRLKIILRICRVRRPWPCPLTTNLVVADETRSGGTICLAVSPPLKAYGISGRAWLFEVKQRVQGIKESTGKEIQYIIAPPRMQRYLDVSTDIYGVYLKYVSSSDIHQYSIGTPELYDRVQEEVARRKAKRATSEKVQNPLAGKYSGKYALSELLVCGKCGAPYRRATWAKKGKKKIVWRCGCRLDYGTQFCKDSPTLEENALHETIMRGIAMQYIDKDADIQILQANLGKALAPQAEGGIADVRTRLAELNQQKQDLVMRCLDENDDGKYDLLLTNIVTEMRSLQERLGELEQQEDTNKLTEARLAEINELLERFSQQDMAYDDTLVRKVVGTIHVKSAEEIEITFRDGRKICCPLS